MARLFATFFLGGFFSLVTIINPPSALPLFTALSPQAAVVTGVHGCSGVLQAQPGSTSQAAEQPSPAFLLPSSQASPALITLSPHTATTGAQGLPGVGHV